MDSGPSRKRVAGFKPLRRAYQPTPLGHSKRFDMKTLVIGFIVLLLIGVPVQSGEISGNVSFGLAETKINHLKVSRYSTQAKLNISYEISTESFHHYLYGGVDTWAFIEPHEYRFNFQPYRTVYTIGYKVKWKELFTGVEHYCSHGVDANYSYDFWQNNKWTGEVSIWYVGVEW